jgi:hypothetical protein
VAGTTKFISLQVNMRNSIQPGDGYFVTNIGGSASITIDNQTQLYPDAPLVVKKGAGSDKVYIVPGTVNQLVPKVDGTYIDALPRPTITLSATGYIILRVERVANQPFPNNPVIYYNATIPADTTTYGYFALASVTKTGSAATGYSYSIASFRSPYVGAVHVSRASYGGDAKYYWWG